MSENVAFDISFVNGAKQLLCGTATDRLVASQKDDSFIQQMH
jgi:hypothetical protein